MNRPAPRAITLPLSAETARTLRAGQRVALSGDVYTARDAAHQRLVAALAAQAPLPLPLRGATIYYTGPSPAPPGAVVGAIGPTTAARMDAFTEPLLRAGLRGMIGKGARGDEVARALAAHGAVYFAAVGGAGALLAQHVTGCELVAYAELGPEAIYRLTLREFPVLVAQDAQGGSVFRH